MALSPDGAFAYVTNNGSRSISVIDLGAKEVVKTIALDFKPWTITVSQDGSKAFVVNNDEEVVTIVDLTS